MNDLLQSHAIAEVRPGVREKTIGIISGRKVNRLDLHEEIEIPQGITANIENHDLIIKKDSDEVKRRLNHLVDSRLFQYL